MLFLIRTVSNFTHKSTVINKKQHFIYRDQNFAVILTVSAYISNKLLIQAESSLIKLKNLKN